MANKTKLISLSEEAFKQLSKDAIDAGTNLKNYIEQHLEKLAEKSAKKK